MSTVKWVAGGYGSGGGAIAYSSDGINWTQMNVSSLFNGIFAIAHNGSVWVAASNGTNYLGYSYDGITWYGSANGNTIFSSGQVIGVAYGNDKFVAVGSSTNFTIAYSTNGINWTGCANASFFGGSYGYCVTYKNSTWVAGAGGNGYIGYSTNGINWTAVNTGLIAVCGIDWNSTYWVIVGNNTLYSSNLTSWSGASGGTFPTVARAIKWNGSRFISVGQDNGGSVQFKTSTNGTSWTGSTPANCTNPMLAVNYSPYTSSWVIGKEGTYKIIYSTDGVTWTNSTSSLSNFSVVRSVAYALPPPYSLGTVPVITSITNGYFSFNVNFNPSNGGVPSPTTYYYSLDGGSTYTNANTTTSPILITGVNIATSYNITIIANNLAGNTAASNISIGFIPYPCFLEGSKILRFSHETYQDEYVPVESLRKGDLIATAESGYQPIHSIGYKTIPRPKSDPNPSNRLYKFSKKTCPTIFEPLYITGEHCTLHRNIPENKRDLITEHMGDVYITEEYYRMPAFLDDRGESYDGEDNPVTIWHFALEHENVAHNYGVFANGLLVESCAIESLMEKSGMRLLE